MAGFHGIQVYEILENGNLLNAIYTNTGLSYKDTGILNKDIPGYHIDNEIARKKIHDNKGVEGLYNCRFIETNNHSVMSCDLEILKYGEVYEFTWKEKDGNEIKWKGLGLMTGATHISVSYA